MKFNRLRHSDIKAPEVCLDAMTWGMWNTETGAHEQFGYAISRGIIYFYTTEMYPGPTTYIPIGNLAAQKSKFAHPLLSIQESGSN